MQNGVATLENTKALSYKVKPKSTIRVNNCTSRYLSKRNKNFRQMFTLKYL